MFFFFLFSLTASLVNIVMVVYLHMDFVMFLVQVNAIDRLLTSSVQSEEILWVLWELCSLSRWNS